MAQSSGLPKCLESVPMNLRAVLVVGHTEYNTIEKGFVRIRSEGSPQYSYQGPICV